MTASTDASRRTRIAHGDDGTGYVTVAFTMLMALTAVACLGLLVDGGRITAARRQADVVSFQAARAAAQHLDPAALRGGDLVVTDTARAAATDAVTALLTRAGLNGQLAEIAVNGRRVTVAVTIDRRLTTSQLFGHSSAIVTGRGTARIGAGVASEETSLP